MPGTVHRLNGHWTVFFDVILDLVSVTWVTKLQLGEEHILHVVVVMARCMPELLRENQWGLNLLIAAFSQKLTHVISQ